jgi:hypothetical protein
MTQFGLVIAYLLPGFIGLAGIAPHALNDPGGFAAA